MNSEIKNRLIAIGLTEEQVEGVINLMRDNPYITVEGIQAAHNNAEVVKSTHVTVSTGAKERLINEFDLTDEDFENIDNADYGDVLKE